MRHSRLQPALRQMTSDLKSIDEYFGNIKISMIYVYRENISLHIFVRLIII